MGKCLISADVIILYSVTVSGELGLWRLTPLSTVYQLYRNWFYY